MMELSACFLLLFDRATYIYQGELSMTGYVMVRFSNFMVFFLTCLIIWVFNLYLIDLLLNEGKSEEIPGRLKAVNIGTLCGMAMVVLSHFTGIYYTFDQLNRYQRGPGFLLCYLVPVFCPILQYTVIRRYRHVFSRLIYASLVLYIFVPILVGIIQIFTYGLSIVNMSLALVSVSLYIFTYLDINDVVVKAHEKEVGVLQAE